MIEKNGFKARQPDYKGRLDVSAWKNTDSKGQTYLSIKIANNVNLFKYEKKPGKTEAQENEI